MLFSYFILLKQIHKSNSDFNSEKSYLSSLFSIITILRSSDIGRRKLAIIAKLIIFLHIPKNKILKGINTEKYFRL